MIVHTDSFRYLWEVLENNEYSFMFKNLVIMDLGCNVGAFTLWAHPFAEQIHAVDMNIDCINLLNKTIKDNSLTNIKTYVEKIDNTNSLEGFMSGHAINHVDILKMDIEGDELDVVLSEGFPAHRINAIVGEHHYSTPILDQFIKRINDLGYKYVELPNNHFIARKYV